MNLSFYRYFFSYIFKSKTRQKLLFLSVIGLILSSFSLVVLQGVMGGLQNGLIKRSQNVLGVGAIDFISTSQKSLEYKKLIKLLDREKINYIPELEVELMVKNENLVSPLILHAMDFSKNTPDFLKGKDLTDLVLGSDIAREIRSFYGTQVDIITPSYTTFIIEEVPRRGTTNISDFITTELPEVDAAHGWIRLNYLQNLIRKRNISQLRIFERSSLEKVIDLEEKGLLNIGKIETWEDKNSTLVWALNLETKVMLFLFAAMSVLIGVCITSGFLIFYNKIRVDLASFWILGLSKSQILKLVYRFGQSLSVVFCLIGLGLGLGFLGLLENNQLMILPDYFVERQVPVKIDYFEILLAFFIPYIVSSLFTHYTFRIFSKANNSFISLIRKVG